MLVQIKPGVILRGVQPEIVIAVPVIASVYDRFGYDCIITSGREGAHVEGSRHYLGLALDFRTRHVKAFDLAFLLQLIQDSLTDEYDVVKESTHLHIEYDPKHDLEPGVA